MNAVVNFPISETSMIDELAELDSKIKFYTEQSKKLKDKIANFYGEGKHRGQHYGVTVTLCKTKTVDHKKLYADLGVSEKTLAKYTTHGASIRVSVNA
jgi:hypothetical protein